MWKDSVHEEISFNNFSGGFIYDTRLPYRKEDFFYLDKKNDTMVLMSGVIYNRNKIIEKLATKNLKIKDPELVLFAFYRWDKDFIKEFNGDFSICIYQKKTNTALLYRDHLGIRPLAYSQTKNATWFSSDPMGLCKALYSDRGVNRKYILNLLIKYGLNSSLLLEDHTLLPNNNVKKVLPGHYTCLTSSSILNKKYWCPEKIKEDKQLTYEKVQTEIKSLLLDAITIRCDRRFYASTHLSGGLDSGVVASIARKEFPGQKEFAGFCWTPIEHNNNPNDFDERELVRKTGLHAGINPTFTRIETQDYINSLSGWRHVTDLFYEDKVRKNAQDKNVNLIFSGWGGDEFISFGSLGIDSDLLFKFQWCSFLKKNPLKNPKQVIGVLLYNILLPAFSFRYKTIRKPLACYSKYLSSEIKSKPDTIDDLFNWRSRRELHLRYLYLYHIVERIEDWGIHGCMDGIEYRYPLVDKRIIEFMLRIPSRLLFKNGINRIIMRELSEDLLPEDVRWHVSKNDPVRMDALYELEDKVCEQLMNRIDEYKSNPELDFINFDLLIQDIEDYKKGRIKERPGKIFDILFFLQKTHAFTKDYIDLNPQN